MTHRATRVGAAAVLAAAAMALVPAMPAVASPAHVGIVVRFADGSARTACTTSGGSGLAVLARRFAPVIGQVPPYAGFVFSINGHGSTHPDATHYWSYWHSRGNGTWSYSSAGPGTYTPKAGTVEGWSYVAGRSAAPAPPPVTYAALCGSADPKPAATSAPQPTRTRPRPTTASTPRRTRTSPPPVRGTPTSAQPTPTRAVTAASPKRSRPSASTAPATTQRGVGATAPRSLTTAPREESAPASAGPIRAADSPSAKSTAGFPAWGTVLALIVVLVLGGTAWWHTRRRPG